MRRQDARWRDLWLAALVVVVAASVVGPTTCQLVPPAAFNEFQLVGQAGAETRLPCLIGKQLHCGEPYFIAWYKFNATGRSWTRIEHLGRSEKAEPVGQRRHSAGALSSPLNDRVHFLWARSSRPANCPAGPSSQLSRFDCAQLSISSLEPLDEGQYKCEITFSESLDFDRCPASTLTELQVVARPNEPEISLNGRPLAERGTPEQSETPAGGRLQFREGAQVRLECQSSGGRPAPRIEWLNLSSPLMTAGAGARAEVQLMRNHWPLKRTSSADPLQPTASTAMTISLSRADLQSRFLCLVLPQTTSGQLSSAPAELPAIVRDGPQLALQLEQVPMLAGSWLAGSGAPMLKWIKLDVLVKPKSVSMQVLDVASGAPLEPVQEWAGEPQPVHLLEPNKFYAIQCLVADSRPASQVHWFNRTAPLELESVELAGDSKVDFEMPKAAPASHRLSSFVRRELQSDGTSRTMATLLLRTNLHDELEELSCRAANEAFHLDELLQVAPILSARLAVTYPPRAWLESEPSAKWTDASLALALPAGASTLLRCFVAANPLAQNQILQIEWLKDGRRLLSAANQAGPAGVRQRLQIEKANHLHMGSEPSAAVPASRRQRPGRLLTSSSLTIRQASKSDAGLYNCQFKLIPTPSAGQGSAGAQQPARVSSGQAPVGLQLTVIEAKSQAPTIRLAADTSSLLLVAAGKAASKAATATGRPPRLPPAQVVVEPRARLRLKCELPMARRRAPELGHKVLWFLNGQLLWSASSDSLNVSMETPVEQPGGEQVAALLGAGGLLTCAHQLLDVAAAEEQSGGGGESFSGNSMRVLHSANEIEIRPKVGPRLLVRRALMPPLRSFSASELSVESANRLKLVCLALCEPLCSIHWLINKRPLGPPDSGSGPGPTRQFLALDDDSNRTLIYRTLGRFEPGGPALGVPMWRLENRIHRRNSSRFGWLKQSSLQPAEPAWQTSGAQLELAGRLLAREAAEFHSEANVFSKLELSYNQIGRLLAAEQQVEVECKLNGQLDGDEQVAAGADEPPNGAHFALGHARLEPLVWFPALGSPAADQMEPADDQSELSFGPLNLTELFREQPPEVAHWLDPAGAVGPAEAMQMSISLDKPPNLLGIAFVGPSGQAEGLSAELGLSLTESRLAELLDPNKPAPSLRCLIGPGPTPAAHFRWTFANLNETELRLDFAQGHELNLRQFVEWRQRQLRIEPSLNAIDLIASIVGNFTCSLSNLHGTGSVSFPIRVSGRPLCKLSLLGQSLSPQGELFATLRCSSYSNPALLEAVWFRNNQQVAANKSDSGPTPLTSASELTVQVLSRRQEFLLADLMSQSGNFKCLGRNQFGFSEACELGQLDKQMLLSAFRPMLPLPSGPAQSSFVASNSTSARLDQSLVGPPSNGSLDQSGPILLRPLLVPSLSPLGWLAARLDWLLVGFSLAALLWLLGSALTALVRRRYPARSKFARRNPTGWRFNSSRASSSNDLGAAGSVPFGQSKVCANYYGDSNGDSEHDMVQSCSQSSHYEDFVQYQLQQRQQQPIYFNHQQPPVGFQPATGGLGTTLRRPPIKSSFSASSAGAESSTSRRQLYSERNHLLAVTTTGRASNNNDVNNNSSSSNNNNNPAALYSQVPLVSGAHNTSSRIQLDQQQQQTLNRKIYERFSRDQQLTFGKQQVSRIQQQQPLVQEHIYDDVVHNQMIL